MANTRIGRTVSVAGSRQKATFSAWIKRTGLGESWIAKFGGNYSQGNYMQIGFDDTDGCFIIGDTPSSTPRMQSTRIFRDTNAWYNYVVAFDTTQNTASDRLKFYINGELITAYGTATYPTLNQNLNFNMTGSYNNAWLGGRGESTYEFNGLMSHVNWIDGTAYDASAFGSTDSVTGEWKINTAPSVTYGTNGYFMLKDGNSLTDASGKGNNFTLLTGTLTDTKDCPDNVFATMNPLDNYYPNFNLAYGNTSVGAGNGPRTYLLATMGLAPTGKYYWEIKLQGQSNGASSNSVLFGISQKSTDSTTEDLTDGVASSTVIDGSGRVYVEGSLAGTFGSSYEPSTVMCLAYDAVNNKMYFGKDGTWLNSGDPTSGSTGTGAFTPTATNGAYNNIYIPCWGVNYNSGYSVAFNFGNGSFNTSAVSSAGTNASSNGIFEHDVPTGYTALSTKGLNL